jgi:hypothetical protein
LVTDDDVPDSAVVDVLQESPAFWPFVERNVGTDGYRFFVNVRRGETESLATLAAIVLLRRCGESRLAGFFAGQPDVQ